jgi:hypothetical protein
MAQVNFTQLIKDLQEGERTIKFVKNDGTVRFLRATLRQGAVPGVKGVGKPANPDVVTVYDVENQGWRAFRKDSVLDILA